MIVLLVVNHKVDSIKERGVRRPARSSSRRASAAQRPCRVGPRRAPFRSRRQTFLGFSIAKRNEFQDLACTNSVKHTDHVELCTVHCTHRICFSLPFPRQEHYRCARTPEPVNIVFVACEISGTLIDRLI